MITRAEMLGLISRTRLFSGVSPAELEPLLDDLRVRRFTARTYIFMEGDPGDQLYIVSSGEVKISRNTSGGGQVVFGILKAGDVFGELATLEENAVRSADAETVTETECLVLHRRALVAFMNSHPGIMWRLVTILAGYVRRKDEAFVDLAFHDIPGRVARQLTELVSSRNDSRPPETPLTLQLSQSTLAGLVGASRANVNRALRRFAATGLIRLERGRITVVLPDELARRGS